MPVRTRTLVTTVLLAALLVVATAAPAFAAWFPDTDGHPYEASILALADRGIVNGYDSDHFGPDDPVIRQQFAKMIVLTLGLPVTEADWQDATKPFVDLDTDDLSKLYPHEYVAVCALNNVTNGTDATHFSPYRNITRQQVITMVVRAADNLAPGTLEAVPAGWKGVLSDPGPPHGPNVVKAEYNGLLDGIRADLSAPGLAGWDTNKNATRGEVAEILAQLLYRTGKVLTLTGPAGTQEFSMAELQALPATEGYGGWKNRVGTIVGPDVYRGAAIDYLMGLVGGGTAITVVASDNYELEFDEDAVDGVVTMYDPTTGDEITDIDGELTMILTYSVNGDPLPSENGALRIGFVSPMNDQVTYSGNWAKLVARIEVH